MFERTKTTVIAAATVALIGGLLTYSSPAFAADDGGGPVTGPVTGPALSEACSQAPSPDAARCYAVKVDSGNSVFAASASANAISLPLGPSSIRQVYNLPASTTTATVAIIDAYDDPTADADLAVYRAQYGLPACTIANGCLVKVNQAGSTSPMPATNTGWSAEISLDLDAVSATCPSCHLLLVEANTSSYSDMFAAVARATTMGAKFVSMSWGGGAEVPAFDSTFIPGVAYVASSGDTGYGVSYPASSPDVLAVGGTTLTVDGSARGVSETVWSSSSGAPGSGCSAAEPKPSFQAAIATACANRAVTDVAAVADPRTGLTVFSSQNGGWGQYGGTSLAAPIIASIYALAGTPAPGTNPASYPYNHPEFLHDVTSGSNNTSGACSVSVLCTAGTGWDGPTGLGTPDGVGAFSASGSQATAPLVLSAVADQQNQVGATVPPVSLHATGGTGSVRYLATGLPAGLTLNSTTGVIAGTPVASGSWVVTAQAQDQASAVSTAPFAWTVSAAAVPAPPGSTAPPASTAPPGSAAPPGSTTPPRSATPPTSPAAPRCAGERVVNPSFASSRGWSASAAVIRRGLAHLDGYGRTHTDRLAQSVRLTAGCAAILRVNVAISSRDRRAGADRLTIMVNGHAVVVLTNRSRSGSYAINLSRYAGQLITLSFAGSENASQATTFSIRTVSILNH